MTVGILAQTPSGWDILVNQVINAAYDLGHVLLGFQADTETSIVSECVKCEAYAAVDGDETAGTALQHPCCAVRNMCANCPFGSCLFTEFGYPKRYDVVNRSRY